MDETFHAFLDLHERAVWHEVRDLAFDLRTDGEAVFRLFPRILLGLLEAERHALFLAVDVEHLHVEFLAHLDHFARVAEAAPAHVGDVEQAVHAIEVDERAEVGEVLDHALDGAADLDGVEKALPLFAALLLDEFAARKDDVFPVVVDLDDLEIVGVADELLEILGRNNVDLRAGEKRLDADVDDEAAFDDRLDLAFDEAVAVEDLDDLLPVLAVGCFFLGKDDGTLVVFEAAEENFDFVADLEVVGVVELAQRDDALGFIADIDEDFAVANLQDAAFDDAALFEVAKRFRDQFLHLNH